MMNKTFLWVTLLALLMTSCGQNRWKQGDAVNNGRDYLCSVGVWNDSLAAADLVDELTFDDDGAALPHLILSKADCEALQLHEVMSVDSNTMVRAWGVREFEGMEVALLMGETVVGDMSSCWLASYDKRGMTDFMLIGECGGRNHSYQDDVDEHTCHIGLDSMRLSFPDGDVQATLRLNRRISMVEQCDDADEDSVLWSIGHVFPVMVDANGHFNVGGVEVSYSADTAVITPYWRGKRQLEVFSWLPKSDATCCDKINAFLDESRGSITDPALLLGDFLAMVGKRFFIDRQGFVRWCCDHPDTQLSRATVKLLKELNPKHLDAELEKIKDSGLRERARRLLGIK